MQHSTPGLLPGQSPSATTNGTNRPINMPAQAHPHPHPLAAHPTANPPPPQQQQPQGPSTTLQHLTVRLTRSIQNVFTQASAMLLSDDPNASQLFEQLEQLTIASDQSLLYLLDTDGLLQMESANVYPPSLPLSMSSSRDEYWRSSYDVARQQWAVMDKLRSRHSTLKQAAADFWPAPPQPPPSPALPTTADADTAAAAVTVKQQDEQMDDGSTAAASAVDAASTSTTAAGDGQASEPIDLTQRTSTDGSTPSPLPAQPQPPTDAQPAGGSDAMSDTQVESSPTTLLFAPPPQQLTPSLPQSAESPSQIERPEPIEAARSVMDLTDDL